jgi:hypothetical protein
MAKSTAKTIELDEGLGVVGGQEVAVQVTMLKPKKRLPGPPPGWRPGNTKTTAGLLADLCSVVDVLTPIVSLPLRRESSHSVEIKIAHCPRSDSTSSLKLAVLSLWSWRRFSSCLY